MTRLSKTLGLAALAMLILPAMALAEDIPPVPSPQLLNSTQFYAMLAAAFVPAVTYLLNHNAPWLSEPVKATVMVAAAAAAGVVAQLIDAGDVAFDTATLQTIGIAVFSAVIAHLGFWKPSHLNAKLGGGTNAQDNAPGPQPGNAG